MWVEQGVQSAWFSWVICTWLLQVHVESLYSELYCCCTYCWSSNHIWTFQPLKTITLCRTCAIHLELPLCEVLMTHRLCGTCLLYYMLRWLWCPSTNFGVPSSAVFLQSYINHDDHLSCTVWEVVSRIHLDTIFVFPIRWHSCAHLEMVLVSVLNGCSSKSLMQFMLWTLWNALVSTIEMHKISSKILPFVHLSWLLPIVSLKRWSERLIPPTFSKDPFTEPSDGCRHQRSSKIAYTYDLPLLVAGGHIALMACCCSLQRWPIKKSTNFHIVQNFLHFLEIIFYTWSDKGNHLSSTTPTSLHSGSLTKKANHVD